MNNAIDEQLLKLVKDILETIATELETDIPARAPQIAAFVTSLEAKYGL